MFLQKHTTRDKIKLKITTNLMELYYIIVGVKYKFRYDKDHLPKLALLFADIFNKINLDSIVTVLVRLDLKFFIIYNNTL